MATMEDIAKKVGVSKGTVSKALNGAADVSETLRKTIVETAVELGYTRARRGAVRTLCIFIENMGYTHIYAPDLNRTDYTRPLLDEHLRDSLVRVNRGMPGAAIDEAVGKLNDLDSGSLVQKNRVFTDWLQNGVTVKYVQGGEERSGIVRLVDYDRPENNEFLVVNQYTFVENGNTRRPDVILFINGLPLVLMELKSPSQEGAGTENAYRQIRNYMQDIPSLFYYNAICVISDLSTNMAGTITSGLDRFMQWKRKSADQAEDTAVVQFETFYEGMFQKERLLDILQNFILFSGDSQKPAKILAGYHQYFAVRKAVERARQAARTDGKGGVFWHTQGSGKSLSMVFYAHLLQTALDSPTIVVMTDRIDLDDQLYTQFARCAEFLRQTPVQAESKEHLKKLLDGRQANGILFTTMFKFERGEKPLSERRNIVVMADEAHRGQYGFEEKLVLQENAQGEKEARTVVGNARIIREALPNATYVGFTGTPISARDRNTREVFGDYIDIYDMTQAVEDGATRPVYYESRVIHLKLDETTLRLIDQEYDLMAENADPPARSTTRAGSSSCTWTRRPWPGSTRPTTRWNSSRTPRPSRKASGCLARWRACWGRTPPSSPSVRTSWSTTKNTGRASSPARP